MKEAILSALVSGFLTAVLSVFTYIIGVGDIFSLDSRVLINIGIMSFLTTAVSLIKAGLTNEEGKIGGIKIK